MDTNTLKEAFAHAKLPPSGRKTRTISELLTQYVVVPNGCHEWAASRWNDGYGQIARRMPDGSQKQFPAHRLQWINCYGPIPEGLIVMHKCDNRGCIKPEHLMLGTHQDNSDDKWDKGRGGTKNGVPLKRRRFPRR